MINFKLNFRTAREDEKQGIALEREGKSRLRDEALMQRARNKELLAQVRRDTTTDRNPLEPLLGK